MNANTVKIKTCCDYSALSSLSPCWFQNIPSCSNSQLVVSRYEAEALGYICTVTSSDIRVLTLHIRVAGEAVTTHECQHCQNKNML